MSIFHNSAARTLIWLAAMTLPVQGLSAVPSGCTSRSCCQKNEPSAGCCAVEKVVEGHRCCNDKRATPAKSCCTGKSCCPCGSHCTCGPYCECGKAKRPMPATPPVENKRPEQVTNDLVSTGSIATVYQPQVTYPCDDASSESGHLAALDRCISLCRFML